MEAAAIRLAAPLAATRPLVALVLLLSCSTAGISTASACELSLVAPTRSALKNPVEVHTSLAGDVLIARFSVTSSSINAKRELGPGEHPYQYDVVEVFATFSERGFPYFEFEVSPYNQTFQVRINDPKQHQEGVDLGLTSTAEIAKGGWTAQLKIPLKALGWDGDPGKIRGNLYSVLGQAKKRSYWSAFLPKAARPNFHQVEYFKPLLQCAPAA
ncbi:MAG TPA: carbohydrate-binding family 9-like protein [Bradyrhizobium sp.]|uniref:carbohydrate-binding family 9-like protein n=1 Tax=Bradyrhizobium sp. TaxID=376 RepID=UPI002D7EF8E9|nr:carbohydrate-binding family 9-like protein [Bradyrhizobium sp.]HET7888645.1 carbohydrate-binding family 9-like protein [Bradyrhizobium sp.]